MEADFFSYQVSMLDDFLRVSSADAPVRGSPLETLRTALCLLLRRYRLSIGISCQDLETDVLAHRLLNRL